MRIKISLTVAMVIVTSCMTGGENRGESPDTRIEALLLEYEGDDRPGACLLARHRGKVIYERCSGMAELETKRAATPETNFRLASLTKGFTATAVLQLVDDGLIETTTALPEVLEGFPPYGRRITVHHLLTHTSGLIDYEDLLAAGEDEQIKDAGVLELMKAQDSTYFVPGSAFRYSNSAYAVLAMMVEEVSEKDFATFLKEAIFDPLGMAATVAHEARVTTVANRAYGYSRQEDGSWTRTDQSRTSAVLGDGGIYSSLRDLNKWLNVVEGRDHLLAAELAARTLSEAVPTDEEGVRYGYGWFVDEYQGRRRYRHGGSTIGFRNEIQRLPNEDLTVLFLSNRNELNPSLPDSIVGLFLQGLEGG